MHLDNVSTGEDELFDHFSSDHIACYQRLGRVCFTGATNMIHKLFAMKKNNSALAGIVEGVGRGAGLKR